MTKKSGNEITDRHFVSFSDILGQLSTPSVYGKLIKNSEVQPGAGGIFHPSEPSESLQLAQVVGYSEQGRCIRLDEPQIVAMPSPDGPADGCGWDPAQYVVWRNLPKHWVTAHLQVQSASLNTILTAKGGTDQQLRADQVVQILTDCIPRSGGNNNPIELGNVLQSYGFDKDGLVVFASWVIGNSDYGVPAYHFQLPKDSLDWLTVGTKLVDVAKTVQNKAVPA